MTDPSAVYWGFRSDATLYVVATSQERYYLETGIHLVDDLLILLDKKLSKKLGLVSLSKYPQKLKKLIRVKGKNHPTPEEAKRYRVDITKRWKDIIAAPLTLSEFLETPILPTVKPSKFYGAGFIIDLDRRLLEFTNHRENKYEEYDFDHLPRWGQDEEEEPAIPEDKETPLVWEKEYLSSAVQELIHADMKEHPPISRNLFAPEEIYLHLAQDLVNQGVFPSLPQHVALAQWSQMIHIPPTSTFVLISLQKVDVLIGSNAKHHRWVTLFPGSILICHHHDQNKWDFDSHDSTWYIVMY